ncbi:HP1 family phage holin [Photobacterium leiognathi]|uniref:HP1 family phage holin n=1 Tax=Photobacterium leiognathi TaxID=553611 RepID=UPI0005A9762F|nr:HP1 family phage holin [Photobacterium leiognathi]PSW48349.1 hypothetical protein CTM83_20160 [Photobacterium leiognathi subsp. mandapamensis]
MFKHLFKKTALWWSTMPTTARADEVTSGATRIFAGATAFLGAFSVQEWGVIIGICLGIGSFSLSWYYKRKNHELLKQSLINQQLMKEMEQ